MNLSSVQQRAVDELLEYFKESYYNDNINKIIEFKAPTGSGKTFMISNFIDKASIYHHDLNQDWKIIFVIATLSSAKLPIQMENNINEYLSYLENKNLKVKRYESPSSSSDKLKDGDYRIIANNNEIIIFGTQSFGKGKIYTEQGIFNAFLDQIEKENYKLVYIRDEAHIGSEKEVKDSSKFLDYDETDAKIKDESVRFEQKIQKVASFIVKMTATPKGKHKQVIITENDLANDNIHLLKNHMEINWGLSLNDEEQSSSIDNIELLKIAITKFKQIKKNYVDFNKEPGLVNINPAMLIQVSDKLKENEKEFEDNINLIIKTLKSNNLTYAKYFSSEKIDSDQRAIKSLQDISRNSSDIDTIIFKVGPATGWNIPRACMLLQLRNVSSDTLNIKTIGRIKRNPNPNFEFSNDSIANQYFIYTNNELKTKNIAFYKLREEYIKKPIEFKSGKINEDIQKKTLDNSKYFDKVIHLLNLNKNEILNFINLKYLKEYETNKYLKGQIVTYKDKENGELKECVYQKISNLLELKKFNNKFINQNSKIFTNEIINKINKWYYNQQFNNSIEIFWYVIKNKYFNDILEIYKDSIKQVKYINYPNDEYQLEVKTYLPSLYSENIKNEDTFVKIKEKETKYAYENINKKLNDISSIHYFDSKPEEIFVRELYNYIKYSLTSDIKIWTKNPVHEGIFYQYYLEDEMTIFNSYPDILLILGKDNKKHQVIIEVKKWNDNSTKVNLLLHAYKEYVLTFKNTSKFKLVNNNENDIDSLTMAICWVKDKDEYKLTVYSTIGKIKSEYRDVQWISEILEN